MLQVLGKNIDVSSLLQPYICSVPETDASGRPPFDSRKMSGLIVTLF